MYRVPLQEEQNIHFHVTELKHKKITKLKLTKE